MAEQKTRLSEEAFEDFLSANPHGLYELIEGEIVEKMVTEEHGSIASNIVIALGNYLKKNKIGRVLVETRYRPEDDEQNHRLPDVSFRRTSAPLQKKGAVLGMPDLAVEIKSPDDTNKEMRATAEFYLANGSKMVWLIFPEKRIVEVHQLDADFQILLESDAISGGELLPDFSLPVADIFA